MLNIIKAHAVNNLCFIAAQEMVPQGIVVHSTGVNNPNLKRYVDAPDEVGVNRYGNHWNVESPGGRNVCVHAFIGYDKDKQVRVAELLPHNICCWGVGKGKKGSYNYDPAYIQFEICEDKLDDRSYYEQAFGVAAEYCAKLCKEHGIEVDKIVGHCEAYRQGYGSNHADPEHWMKKFGETMDDFRSKVAELMAAADADKETCSCKAEELFRSLCSFKAESFDESLLEAAATPAVLGHLFFNRMQAVAYGTLMERGMLGKVNREFRNSLKAAYEQNIEKNRSFFKCVQYVDEVLAECQCGYAMLKGAYLCKVYPEGYRTSNDIDLLVLPEDVTRIGEVLIKAGFRQGNIRNGSFVPATRKEIIESKMMRGETVPYIKEVNLPGMQFLEVDINFSLDYKPGDAVLLEEMIRNTTVETLGDYSVRTLRREDFFVHLCSHLYKEATTLPWVEMMRDMTLYKYCDIYMLLSGASEKQVDFLFERARELRMEKICAFAVLQMSELFDFDNRYAVEVAKNILADEPDFIHTIIAPKEKKEYVFSEKSIVKRFFADSRKVLLEEVKANENIENETK